MIDHLRVTKSSDRGFKRLPPIPAIHGGLPAGEVRVYESSAASGPHLWLSVVQPFDRNHPDNGQTNESTVHLTAEDAWRLSEQLQYLVEHHYQGDARPDDDQPLDSAWEITRDWPCPEITDLATVYLENTQT